MLTDWVKMKMPEEEEIKERIKKAQDAMESRQLALKEHGLPVIVLLEGWGAAGKGSMIGKLIRNLDPRFFKVLTPGAPSEEEKRRPFLYRYFTGIPQQGKILFMDGGWIEQVTREMLQEDLPDQDYRQRIQSIRVFERQLSDNGYLLIKCFLQVDKKEQKKRFDKLAKNKETAWRVTQGDIERNARYGEYADMMEDMLFKTDTDYAPWTIIESMDRRFATVKIYTTVIKAMANQIEKVEKQKADEKAAAEAVKEGETLEASIVAREADREMKELQVSILSKADLSLKYTREEYKEKLKKLQKKIEKLHGELYRRRIPVVLGFEGWDAGGKGGAIKRLTQKMDPRGYVVNPTASPNDIEKAHHYLWRFWKAMPKDGHVAIFDRTWYGRVMVERIEGFCTKEEWQRAYKEINDMEKDLYDAGAIVIKFWMHIDKDEQERRFKERQENPEKQWKITDEDWRNREKWDQYEDSVNEMLLRTSTDYAPWIVVEGNDKYYARVKVLSTVVKAIEARLKEK